MLLTMVVAVLHIVKDRGFGGRIKAPTLVKQQVMQQQLSVAAENYSNSVVNNVKRSSWGWGTHNLVSVNAARNMAKLIATISNVDEVQHGFIAVYYSKP